MRKATWILANGSVFSGTSIGGTSDLICEMVFNTSMTGDQEILTDPSYAGQGVVMSYPCLLYTSGIVSLLFRAAGKGTPVVQWFKVILAHQSVKVKRKPPWRGPFFEKRYKKTSGDCRQRTGRAPWYHLFLPPPRECGLNGYPAIPSLCTGRTRFRSCLLYTSGYPLPPGS